MKKKLIRKSHCAHTYIYARTQKETHTYTQQVPSSLFRFTSQNEFRKNRLKKKKKKDSYANIQYSRTSTQSQHGDLHDYKTIIHVKLVRKIGRRDI